MGVRRGGGGSVSLPSLQPLGYLMRCMTCALQLDRQGGGGRIEFNYSLILLPGMKFLFQDS
jgi:hypothetical protein